MNFPKFPYGVMFVGATNFGKTEYLLRILETEHKNHFEFIIIMCPTILDNIHVSRIKGCGGAGWPHPTNNFRKT